MLFCSARVSLLAVLPLLACTPKKNEVTSRGPAQAAGSAESIGDINLPDDVIAKNISGDATAAFGRQFQPCDSKNSTDCASDTDKNGKTFPAPSKPDRQLLALEYPSIEAGSKRAENTKILCPFHRLLERAGIYDAQKPSSLGSLVLGIKNIAAASQKFGCSVIACGGVATLVSAGQFRKKTAEKSFVNLESLHTAIGIAHDCAFTFTKGDVSVNTAMRSKVLAALAARADKDKRLKYADLEAVKQKNCADQGLEDNAVGRAEIGLLYTFLGGNDRGFVDLADVERFFHAELPKTLGTPGMAKKEAQGATKPKE